MGFERFELMRVGRLECGVVGKILWIWLLVNAVSLVCLFCE